MNLTIQGSFMSLMHDTGKCFRTVAVPFMGLAMGLYFLFHIFHGDRGLLAWLKLQKQVARAVTTAAETNDQKAYLENRVRLLNPGSLDPDMLEERARLMLNFGLNNEVVILDPERNRK
ncbi:MAG: septum formation initiator family protein [Rhodospirillaceae bacterium]